MTNESPGETATWKWYAKLGFRLSVFAVVVWFLWHALDDAWTEINQNEELQGYMRTNAGRWELFRSIHFGWLGLAMTIYLAGLMFYCWFWHRTLYAMGQRPHWWETIRAYYVGHLGKYVPGKALVVGLRIDFIRSPRTNATIAGTSVFVETLTMMAVGAAIAAFTFVVLGVGEWWFLPVALLVMLGTGIPTWPPIFRRLVKKIGIKRLDASVDQAVDQLDFKLMGFGWLTNVAGWFLLGLSLWACICALPDILQPQADITNPLPYLPLVTAAVAFAMVGGFLSLLPGGVGIRELVILALLTGPFGHAAAAVAAIFLRLIMLLSEVAISAILVMVCWFLRPD